MSRKSEKVCIYNSMTSKTKPMGLVIKLKRKIKSLLKPMNAVGRMMATQRRIKTLSSYINNKSCQ